MAKPSRLTGALEAAYRDILTLCDGLEAIADALPEHIDARPCYEIAEHLEATLQRLQQAEVDELFPLLLLRSDPGAIARRQKAHIADAAAASEVADALNGLLRGDRRPTPDALGYLLRAFFDGMRRHVATETEWLHLGTQALGAPPPGKTLN
ncbi:MAG: hemerythrin domain-containing protein [Devosia sp.]|nr:hemerythrin domain-containing protein [Devosia sp.]